MAKKEQIKKGKTTSKKRGAGLWLIVTCLTLAVMFVVTNLATTTFYKAICTFLGNERRVVTTGSGSNTYFDAGEYDSKEKAKAHGDEVNEKISEEGFVLLKNESDVLPLVTQKTKNTPATNTPKVSVFGKNSVRLAYSGSGSGAADTSNAKTIYDSLTAAGYEYNTALKAFYEDDSRSGSGRASNPKIESGDGIAGFATGETPVSAYAGLESSYADSDIALVVITRIGGEGYDMPTTMKKSFNDNTPVEGAMSAEDHYFELDKNEQEMLAMVCEAGFEKIVLVVNSASPMELGFLDAEGDGDTTVIDYDFASKIQGAIWVGYPGNTGIMALGEILNGNVNPSGHLVDTYAKDFTQMPAYNNTGLYGVTGTDSYTGTDEHFSDYEEGIYVGYRYYETRYETEGTNGDAWYKANVAYPFGYGESYTEFSWEVIDSQPKNKQITTDTEFSVTVRVKNVGSVAGKDVVQAYMKAPYTGKIEKAAKTLVGYAKTGLIEPGKYDDVTITFNSYDFASYDYLGKVDGYKGYLLEAGIYSLVIGENAHDNTETIAYETLGEVVKFPTSNGTEVLPLYEDADDQLGSLLSRSDWTGSWPQKRTAEEKVVSQELLVAINSKDSLNPLTAESEEIKNANLNYAKSKKNSELQLWQLIAQDYDAELWDQLLEKITLSSMFEMCSDMGSFGTVAIEYVGKYATIDSDGPNGFSNFLNDDEIFGTCFYGSQCILAATWNIELAYEMGEAIGYEGINGYTYAIEGKEQKMPYSGWYAPGVNLHRTPFGGRNSEYYSEDTLLTGVTAANVIQGARSKGVYCFMKHFAVNEQETHRAGVCTWLTEQTLRELYLKPFEIAVKRSDGQANGVMSSFNRIGTKWTGGDYRLLTTILRDEWGFEGAVVTDFADKAYMDNKQMTYAGGDIRLSNLPGKEWVDKENPVDVYMLKQSTKNVLYVVANSCAMNGIGDGVTVTMLMPYWQIALYVADGVIVAGCIIWGICLAFKSKKVKKK